MKWYSHVLRMSEERMPKKGLDMKIKRKRPIVRQRSRREHQVRKEVI
jgi:hypothetical protein